MNKSSVSVRQTASADQTAQADHALPQFCLLMSVYAGNSVTELRRAVESGTIEQQLPPTQVVIVRDGPVGADLQQFLDLLPETLELWFTGSRAPELTIVPLAQNGGLAHALNQGLQACKYDVVARADADDISLPDRFSTMIPHFAPDRPHIDALGSAIQEFTNETLGTDAERAGQIRLLPAGGKELEKFARMQSPLHHPSVVFRRSSVLKAGGYPEHSGRFEDYLLWSRMLLQHCVIENLPDVLVLYQADENAYKRRGGRDMFHDEWRLQCTFRKEHFTTFAQFVRNVAVRVGYRLVPTSWREKAYHLLVRLRNGSVADAKTADNSGATAGSSSSAQSVVRSASSSSDFRGASDQAQQQAAATPSANETRTATARKVNEDVQTYTQQIPVLHLDKSIGVERIDDDIPNLPSHEL
ncbi:glycosyl transferase family 2 [Bifidobacterium dolichotidis]|uniref:Glycosyl transferase family 2 n=1 Tax=Bifidobacterium dolichotidis TaxID=2306976 RepID=A0A430FKA2_9BIFI|nr:glycosyl transferase family 2 [Bifidobacterium dolichotidis]